MAKMNTQELIKAVSAKNADVRAKAVLDAGPVGAEAIEPLAAIMTNPDFEIGRAAKRAMWKIVRHAGRPGADDNEQKQVVDELIKLAGGDRDAGVKCEVLWMLSECAGDEAISTVVALLAEDETREYARMTLERIPGEKSLTALKKAMNTVPENFKLNIAQSLRARGVEVKGYPCKKLTPVKQTEVKPVGRK
jgi:hypothetical protein